MQTTQSKIGQRPRHFSKEQMQMTNRHVKRCSTSPIIREMQIKTAMMHCISHRSEWPTLKSLQIINWRKCEEKGTLPHCWSECKLV